MHLESGKLMVNSGGVCNTMLKYFFISLFIFSNVSFANEATASLHTEVNKEEQKKNDILNEINIEKYKEFLSTDYKSFNKYDIYAKLILNEV